MKWMFICSFSSSSWRFPSLENFQELTGMVCQCPVLAQGATAMVKGLARLNFFYLVRTLCVPRLPSMQLVVKSSLISAKNVHVKKPRVWPLQVFKVALRRCLLFLSFHLPDFGVLGSRVKCHFIWATASLRPSVFVEPLIFPQWIPKVIC